MKKIFLGFVFIFLLPFLIATSTSAIAPRLTPAPEVKQVQQINYTMPYPGILPDHPLYFLKMIRDRILDFIIKEPAKKTDFLILMSDKRIGAGKALIEGNKVELGITTLGKGQIYFGRAVEEAVLAKRRGGNINNMLDKMEKSAQKHIELLEETSEKLPETNKPALKNILSQAQKEYQRILELKK